MPTRSSLWELIKLVLGQQTLYESGLEHADHVLAVSVGRPETAAALPGC